MEEGSEIIMSIRKLIGTAVVIAVIFTVAYLGFDRVHNVTSRFICDGGTVTHKEAYNNYHPGWFNKIKDSNFGKSDLEPDMYVLHVDDGGFWCSSDHDFAVSKQTYDSVNLGDTYSR